LAFVVAVDVLDSSVDNLQGMARSPEVEAGAASSAVSYSTGSFFSLLFPSDEFVGHQGCVGVAGP
jgi:hypothetical protein